MFKCRQEKNEWEGCASAYNSLISISSYVLLKTGFVIQCCHFRDLE